MPMPMPIIRRPLVAKTLLHRPTAVLTGRTGAGKTSLYNNLCGTRYKSGAGKGSVTQELYRNPVCVGAHPFYLMDTPGTDSSSETYKHAVLLKEALTATKINTIFLVMKYDNRFEKMVESYFQEPVDMFGKKVVVMVSHLDESKNPEKDFEAICEVFAVDCPQISNLIFFSEQSPSSMVANLMFACISNMGTEQIEISNEEFHLKFNIFQMKGQMNKSFVEYQRQVNVIRKEYSDLVNKVQSKTQSTEVKDDIFHMFIVEFKNEIEVLREAFVHQHGVTMGELEHYALFIKMQKENVKMCDDFGELVIPLMSYNLFDNKDPRNLIKKCPHCDLIWFKVDGCDGETACGDIPRDPFDECVKAVYTYVIKRVNGIRKYEKNSMSKKPHLVHTDERTTKKVGCGRKIMWKDLPKLDEKLILELYKVKTIDEAKTLIENDQFNEVREKYEKNINKKVNE